VLSSGQNLLTSNFGYYSLSRMTLYLRTQLCTLSEHDLIVEKVQIHMTQAIIHQAHQRLEDNVLLFVHQLDYVIPS
jgi:hypothetical protein